MLKSCKGKEKGETDVVHSIRAGFRRFQEAAWQIPHGLVNIPSRLQLEIADKKAGALQGENHFPREPPLILARTASISLREYGA